MAGSEEASMSPSHPAPPVSATTLKPALTPALQPAPASRPLPVVTLLSADERLRVDAAGQGHYVTLHRETIDDVVADVRARPLGGILLSVSSLGRSQSALPAAARVA